MASMTVGKRLGLGFGAVITLMIVIATVGIMNMRTVMGEMDDIINDKFPKTVWANNVVDGVNTIARAMRNALLESEPAKIQKEVDRITEQREIIKENIDKLDEKITSPEGKEMMSKVKEARADYVGLQDEFMKLMKEGRQADAKVLLLEKIRASQATYIEAVGKLIDYQEQLMKKTGNDADSAVQSALMLILALAIVAVIVGIVIGLLITRNLMKQLGGEPDYAAEAVHKIAQGDLSHNLALKSGDTTSLLYSLKVMQDSLRGIVAEIKLIVEDAAVRGRFDYKMKQEGKAGYTKELSDLLNQLSNTIDGALKDTVRVAGALSNGDLSQKVTQDYPGMFGQTKEGVNGTVEALTRIVAEIKNIVDAANRGDFSIKMDLAGKAGYTKELSELLNLLSNTVDTAFKDTIHVAQALARGDLTQVVTREYQGAFNDVKQNLNGTVSNLKELVGQIKDATDTINTASKEIASGNADLSQRTEEQASSLEETASSMEELTSTVKQNAENAKQANQLAISSSDIAVKGGAVVGEVVTTMDQINEASKKIVDIISVIDGIAFQTNILALNAAVEAARAGEQGRGFAVVAGEVRNLAQRSAAAAKEIKGLIDNSVEKVEGGSKLVAQAGQTMEEIVTSIKRVTDIMSEITAASIEQTAGIEQVNQAITQMDEVTQQNAALVEEAAAAAEALEEQAQNLSVAVATFKVDESSAGLAVRRAPAPTVAKAPTKAVTKAPARIPAKPKAKAADDEEWQEF